MRVVESSRRDRDQQSCHGTDNHALLRVAHQETEPERGSDKANQHDSHEDIGFHASSKICPPTVLSMVEKTLLIIVMCSRNWKALPQFRRFRFPGTC
jgi:hypothetical protein